MRGIHSRNHLRGGPTEHFWIRVRGRARAVTWVGEAVCRSPQQLHAALFLFCRQYINHLRKIVFVLFQRRAFRRDIHVMEAVVGHVQLVEKLERHVRLALR